MKQLVAAAALGGVLLLAGCSATPTPPAAQSLVIATSAPFTSSNSQSKTGALETNESVAALTGSWFTHYDSTPKLVRDTAFGTETAVSTAPLTVRYTIAKGVTWSDGAPVTAADLLLDWAATISRDNRSAGVDFDSAAPGAPLDLVTSTPTISNGGRSLTMVYSKPYVDWATALPGGMLPAHSVYDLAFPGHSASAANAAVVRAITTGDTATLSALAKAWSTGFDFSSTPGSRSLLPSDGPYRVSRVTADQSVTLVRNARYHWGAIPAIATVTLRVIQSPGAQVQVLQTGGVDLVDGLADTPLSEVRAPGVTAVGVPTADYEHIDLTMSNDGPFSPRLWHGSAAKALEVRKAFLEALPRTEMLDRLVHPIAPTEKLDDSQVLLPGSPGYTASVAANGSSAYDAVDVPAAQALLAKAGVKRGAKLTVRLLYAKSNTMRAEEFSMIQASEAKAGITVVGQPNDSWPDLLGSGRYDAVLFAWDFTSLGFTANSSIFTSHGARNFSGFADATTTKDLAELSTTYPSSAALGLLGEVDRSIWGAAYGATLYQLPVTDAWSSDVRGISASPLDSGVFTDIAKWSNAHS